METNTPYLWLTRIEEKFINKSPLGKFSTITLTIGIQPLILNMIFFYFIFGTAPTRFYFLQILAATVLIVGPFFLYRYETHVFPRFIHLAKDVTPHEDNKKIKEISNKYREFYAKKYYYVVIPWTIILFGALYLNLPYFQNMGVEGFTDPTFIPYIIGWVIYAGVITGIGLHMIITTITCIREVGDLNFSIDPLHPDGLGGLSSIGYFAISSTTLFSIGSLSFPLFFDIADQSGIPIFIYVIVIVYIGCILLSFLYPTMYINRRAKEIRRNVLESKRERIYNYHQEILNADSDKNIDRMKTKLDTLRDEYDEYDKINLYPLSPSIFSKLLSSIMLPLIFLLLETYIVS